MTLALVMQTVAITRRYDANIRWIIDYSEYGTCLINEKPEKLISVQGTHYKRAPLWSRF